MQSLQLATKTPALDQTAESVLDSVPPALWFIRRQMRGHRRDLSLPQFRVLCCVNHEPNVSLSVVADFLGASMPTASRIVSGLVKKGLLERAGSEDDRRQLSLQLTNAGRALMQTSRAGTQEQMEAELKRLSPEQRTVVVQAMDILRDIFGSAGFCLGAKRTVSGSSNGVLRKSLPEAALIKDKLEEDSLIVSEG